MNQLQPAPVRYPADEPQIGPKKPGPRPSDCPWCNTPNCNHCRCPGYPKCDHAPNTLCSRPRYKRRLVCNPCEKHKLTKTTKKNKKSSENTTNNGNDNGGGDISPALSPREKLSHEFGNLQIETETSDTNVVITPPCATVNSSLPNNSNCSSTNGISSNSSSSSTALAAPFVPDPTYQELIYIKEVNSDIPESVISIHKYTDRLSDVRDYIQTNLWDIYQRNDFKFCDKNNNNNNNNNENVSKNNNNNSQNNNNNNKQIREIKRDQEAFIYAWDNTVEMNYPHHSSPNTSLTVRVIQIVYIDPSKSRKRVKKEMNILPYPQQQQQQQQQQQPIQQQQNQNQNHNQQQQFLQHLIPPVLPLDDSITPRSPFAATATATTTNNIIIPSFATTPTTPIINNNNNNNNNGIILSPSSSASSSFLSSSTNPLSSLINFPTANSSNNNNNNNSTTISLPPQLTAQIPPPPPPQPVPSSPSTQTSFNHQMQQQNQYSYQNQHVILRTIPLTSHGEIVRSPGGSSLSNTSYGFGRNRSSNDLTNVLNHYNATTATATTTSTSIINNNNIPIMNINNTNSNRNSNLQQPDTDYSEWC